jgi:hypothetical protein
MRRSICQCEPHVAFAGDIGDWKFVYTTANPISKDAVFRFDVCSTGREIDWEVPSSNLKQASNIIYVLIDGEKPIATKEIEIADSYAPLFEFTLPRELKVGEKLTVVVGESPSSKAKSKVGNSAQKIVQRRKPFHLYIDAKGKGKFEDPELFSLDIRGNQLDNVRIITPSFVGKNRRFDVVLRFEDAYGNLTSYAPEETLIDLTYENLRENLQWQLFVPETGFLILPNLYFNEEGTYRIKLCNRHTKVEFVSPPIRCFPEEGKQLFWGLLHGENERIDSTENIESCLRYVRDDLAHNFFASSPFEDSEETPPEIWKLVQSNVADFNESERFTSLLGLQWSGEDKKEGMRQLIFSKDNKTILRKKEQKNSSLKRIYKSFTPKELLSIPCFTMGKGMSFDFESFNPEFERVVEIYNAWGSSESAAKKGNLAPITCDGKAGIKEELSGSIQEALKKNCRFGFVAGGLDDRGDYSTFFDNDQEQYLPGLTGIVAPVLSRESLFDALYKRSCYATTGERMIVGFQLAQQIDMGGEISTQDKPGLVVNRHLSGFACGTGNIDRAEIIRNGEIIKTFTPDTPTYFFDFEFDDLDPLDKVCLGGKNKEIPFVYYYLRVVQEDGNIAWGSPIWVDYIKPEKKPKVKKV